MKRSPLHHWHEKAGAALAEEDGWYVALRYSTAQQEASAASGSVGLCDLSHIHEPLSPYARVLIAGPNARPLLSKLTSLSLDQASAYGSVAHVRAMVEQHRLGFILMIPRDYAESVWEALLDAGEEFHVTPFGLEALKRLEA